MSTPKHSGWEKDDGKNILLDNLNKRLKLDKVFRLMIEQNLLKNMFLFLEITSKRAKFSHNPIQFANGSVDWGTLS